MLINMTRGEQLRVAIVDGTILQEYQVEIDEAGLTRGNIYRGIVANIQPSLNAAFVDIGEERHGFLPVADVLPSAYHKQPPEDVRRPRVDQVLEKGKPILVQVTKDGVGQKGPALSTNIALAGRYLVLTPFDSVRGISRKAEDDDARKKIRDRLKKLTLPDGHGVIVRTNGLDQNQTTLNRDLNALLRLWRKVQGESEKGPARSGGGRGRRGRTKDPLLLYSDQDLVVQGLRDYLDANIAEVIVDNDGVHEKAQAYMKAFMPRSKTQLIRYEDRLPLFSRYRLETQIDRIYDRSASLPGGGSIVIDSTEALTAIDVNSARATKTSNHDESIFKINCEAAKEVARQLRLRDIGGLVVVDFIDMRLRRHQSKLERVLRDAMKIDKARYNVGRISPNGLLEINRQRIKQALRLRTHRKCPTCEGTGTVPTAEFAALRLLSRIEARAASGLVQAVLIGLHPEIADTLQNHHRQALASIEAEHGLEIEILASPGLGLLEERIEWTQREGGAEAAPGRAQPVFSATDLTPSKGRSRSRSRGRRGDDRGRAEDEAPKQEVEAQEEETQQESQEPSPGRRRRRRRRRKPGRGRGEGRDASAENAEATTPEPEGDDADVKEASPAEAETAEASGEDGGTTKPRRRRRRRRRRGRGGKSAAAEQSDATEQSDSNDQSDAAEHSDAAEEDSVTAAPPGADDAPTDAEESTEAEDGPETDDDSGESRRPRRRRRRRSRRRRKGSSEAESSAETSAEGTGDGQTGEDTPSADGDDEATPSPAAATPDAEAASPPGQLPPNLRWQWWGKPADPAPTVDASDYAEPNDDTPRFGIAGTHRGDDGGNGEEE